MKMATNTNQVPETSISTFVFLDFESTSLLDRKCRITELCLLAVNREDMKDAGNFPRVTNKLTLCLDPKMPISMTSSNMTGLFNDSLEHQKALTDETVALINAFLNHLSKPVCLLAHNGNRFDFPLLIAELKRINQSLDSLLLCADTLEAFRSLDGLPAKYDPLTNQNSGTKNQNSPITSNVTPSKSVPSTSQSPMKRKGTTDLGALNNQSPKVIRQDIEQLSIVKAKKRLEFEEMKTDVKKEGKDEVVEEFSASLEDADYLLALENVENDLCAEKMVFGESCEENVIVCRIQKKVETESKFPAVSTTPSVSVKPCCVANGTGYYVRSNTDEMSNHKRIANESADTVGDQLQTNSGALPANRPNGSPGFKSIAAGQNLSNGSPAAGANGSPGFRRQSYKLGEIYFRKFGCRPPESHRAEDDCVTLVKIAKCSQGFMEWVDTNAALLSTVPAPF